MDVTQKPATWRLALSSFALALGMQTHWDGQALAQSTPSAQPAASSVASPPASTSSPRAPLYNTGGAANPAATPAAGPSAVSPASGTSGATGTASAPVAAPSSRTVAGTIDVVDGHSRVYGPDNSSHEPLVGDKVYEGDSLVTSADAELHINMADGGYIALRPNTALNITRYRANGDGKDTSVIGLLRGSMRSITGWIGKAFPRNYAIHTPDATIGVRGTDHETAYYPESADGNEAGTYDTVHEGGTTLATKDGSVDVTPDHAGFLGHAPGSRPRALDHVPGFFRAEHRHDDLFIGKHAAVMASYQARRAARLQEHASELRQLGRPSGSLRAPEVPARRPIEPARGALAPRSLPSHSESQRGEPARAAAQRMEAERNYRREHPPAVHREQYAVPQSEPERRRRPS